jgi:hypothetical protein
LNSLTSDLLHLICVLRYASIYPSSSKQTVAAVKDCGLSRRDGHQGTLEPHPHGSRFVLLDCGENRGLIVPNLHGAAEPLKSLRQSMPTDTSGDQPLSCQSFFSGGEKNSPTLRIDRFHPGGGTQGHPEPAPLPDGESVNPFMHAQKPAFFIQKRSRVYAFIEPSPQDFRVGCPFDGETRVLAFLPIRVPQSIAPRNTANCILCVPAHRE